MFICWQMSREQNFKVYSIPHQLVAPCRPVVCCYAGSEQWVYWCLSMFAGNSCLLLLVAKAVRPANVKATRNMCDGELKEPWELCRAVGISFGCNTTSHFIKYSNERRKVCLSRSNTSTHKCAHTHTHLFSWKRWQNFVLPARTLANLKRP